MALKEENVMSEIDNLSVEALQLWSDVALKSFLQARNKKVDGLHSELVARAYIAWEEKATVDAQHEHNLRRNLADYTRKLLTSSGVVPDPFSLKEGWLSESSDVTWPSIYFSDISEYLKEICPEVFLKKMIQEYKQGKGYRYFSGGHVQEVFVHPISDKIPVTFLCAKVKPSMKSTANYQVWVLTTKDTRSQPGGSIHSAYCNCPAGLHGSCNHIAGLLFKVENAVMCGTKSSTSKLCVWKMPQLKDDDGISKKLSEHLWKKDSYLTADKGQYPRQSSVKELGTTFTALSSSKQKKPKQDICEDVAAIMRVRAPACSFVQMWDMKPFEAKATAAQVPSIPQRAAAIDSTLDEADQLKSLSEAIVLSPQEIQSLEESTRLQGGSTDWLAQRCGRITASNLKRVYTRAVTLKKDPSKDSSAILKHVMGYNPMNLMTYAVKHGKAAEPHAKVQYKHFQQKHHKKLVVRDSGLHVHPQHSYLAASPDLIVECGCHGKGCVEIKCPWVCRSEAPSHTNWCHLDVTETGLSSLSRKSAHYFQIQGQLAATGLQYCDFFVYTRFGQHLERITTDHEFLEKIFPLIEYFWITHMRPEILSRSLENEDKLESENTDHGYASARAESSIPSACKVDATTISKKAPLSKPTYPCVYLCAICNESCTDNAITIGERSIECSSCKMWVHFSCGGIDHENLPEDKAFWYCDVCS